MKSFKTFAYVAAIAIVSVAVTSCKDKNPAENTGYNPERETVKTQFSINLPGNVTGGAKKMQGAVVNYDQSLSSFNGIEGIEIIPYTLMTAPTAGTKAVNDIEESANANIIPLANIAANSTDVGNNVHSKIYNDVMLPVGTNALLFYGKAIGSAGAADWAYETDDAKRHQYGALEAYTAGTHAGLKTNPFNLNNIYFTPVQINATRPTEATDAGVKLIAYLNSVAAAATADDADKKDLNGNREWANTTELQLSELYTQFTLGYATLATPGLQSGASKNVAAMLNSLYLAVSKLTLDHQFEGLREAILEAINNDTYLGTKAVYDESSKTLTTSLALNTDLNNFPQSLSNKMPDGAAAIAWNATDKKFEAANAATYGAVTISAWGNYVYPASLYYFANSAIKTSANSGVAAGFTDDNGTYGNSNWKTELDKTSNYEKNAVEASTRSIALYDAINYAVGRLDLAVRVKNNAVATRDAGVTLDFNNIPLTGVLIGGVNDAQWDFTPKSGDKTYIYYDNDIANPVVNINDDASWTTIGTTDDGKKWNNFTLVLESAATKSINICLEFENKHKDFHGINGQLIPKGTKFYLVGVLDPTPTETQVFVQDHKTLARITIGDLTGDKAYNVIPDLKVPELEFALSVDLEWQQGMQFDLEW